MSNYNRSNEQGYRKVAKALYTHTADTADPHSSVSDTAYAASWDAVTGIAPSKNAVYDIIADILGFGVANVKKLSLIGHNYDWSRGLYSQTEANYQNANSTNSSWIFDIMLPMTLGSLKLYINKAYLGINSATVNDKVIDFILMGTTDYTTHAALDTDSTVPRIDVIEALNRLSSYFYICMIESYGRN